MNAQQRYQNRRTARLLAQEIFEAKLPVGLTLHDGELRYECPSCFNEREWFGTPDDFTAADAIKVCGGTQWCIP